SGRSRSTESSFAFSSRAPSREGAWRLAAMPRAWRRNHHLMAPMLDRVAARPEGHRQRQESPLVLWGKRTVKTEFPRPSYVGGWRRFQKARKKFRTLDFGAKCLRRASSSDRSASSRAHGSDRWTGVQGWKWGGCSP